MSRTGQQAIIGGVHVAVTMGGPAALIAGTNSGAFSGVAYTGPGDILLSLQPGFEFSPRANALITVFGAIQATVRTIFAPDGSTIQLLFEDAIAGPVDPDGFKVTLIDTLLG